jgi:cytochrome c556
MKRLTAGLLALTALVWLSGRTGAQGEKAADLKATMKKIGDGSSGLFTKLGRELRDTDPTWDDARQMSREIVRLSAGLPKFTPPQGDKASWDKKTKAFADSLAALDQAVAKRDRDTAFAAWKKMEADTCMTCHKVHRK